MPLRCSARGQRFVHAGRESSANALFEPHLPKLALFCLRLTKDPEEAAALAERVLLEASRRIASSRGPASVAGWLYSVLREECASRPREPAPPVQMRTAGEAP
jgi:DNA-directed RNA polymerase specialized sigma24 family protein